MEITALVGTSESIENIQTLVNGATEHTKKALVAMAEGTISIEKNGIEDVPYKYYYFVDSLSSEKTMVYTKATVRNRCPCMKFVQNQTYLLFSAACLI